LLGPRGLDTRPITDRVKVSLCDTLSPYLAGAAVADLFCGTGSLGLEALSRGAAHCWFAERDRSAVELLKRNIENMGVAEAATIWQGDILHRLPSWLAQVPAPLDVVFLDPPYAMSQSWFAGDQQPQHGAVRVFDALANVLAPQGILLFRTHRLLALPGALECLALFRRKEYGAMALNFFQRETTSAAEPRSFDGRGVRQ